MALWASAVSPFGGPYLLVAGACSGGLDHGNQVAWARFLLPSCPNRCVLSKPSTILGLRCLHSKTKRLLIIKKTLSSSQAIIYNTRENRVGFVLFPLCPLHPDSDACVPGMSTRNAAPHWLSQEIGSHIQGRPWSISVADGFIPLSFTLGIELQQLRRWGRASPGWVPRDAVLLTKPQLTVAGNRWPHGNSGMSEDGA